MHTFLFKLLCTLGLLFLACCSCPAPFERPQKKLDIQIPTMSDTTPISYKGLEQVVAYQDWLFSGGKPVGTTAIDTLVQLGIRTIVCVDGTPPDYLFAKQFGIRIFHIPLKYGMPSEIQTLELATAIGIGKSRGNTYVHCHHGKHRSAAGAAIALIALGDATPEQMMDRMVVSETSRHYVGIWDAVRQMKQLQDFDYFAHEHLLKEKVIPNGIVQQMIAINTALDNMKLIKKSNWTTPESHPDLVAAAEAGAITEALRELQKDANTVDDYPADFSQKLDAAWVAADNLEKAIVQGLLTPDELTVQMRAVTKSCTSCHRTYRK